MSGISSVPPRYLQGHRAVWAQSPRQANLDWFAGARWGLFIHYGLYSLLGRGEWVQFHEKIPVAEYARLAGSFRAERFDADLITDLVLEAGMKYVNLVTCHHESFCLWNSRREQFNSVNAPCGRDLVRELAAQCDRKGLGFFCYYTFMLNWRHPYFVSREHWATARPDYAEPQPEYLFRSMADYPRYVEYMLGCLEELLELEYPLAGLWLDIISAYYEVPEIVPVKEAYALIRRKRPEALIAFKQGATGEEDFAAPEYEFRSQGERFRSRGLVEAADRADRAWEANRRKHNEICATLQEKRWGYSAGARHLTADELWSRLAHALAHDCNLLANIGPLPDGSVHETDVATLRAVGRRIRAEGWPEHTGTAAATVPGRPGRGGEKGAAAE
jgi:alpha-L-fucosidase